MTPAFFQSPARVIQFAMKDAGLLQSGDEPNSDQYAEFGQRLLDIINFEQTQGIKLWLQQDYPVTMVAGTSQYIFSPTGNVSLTKPLRVIDGYAQQTSGTSRPIIAISRQEWDMLSNKTQQGAINSYYVDKQQLSLIVNLWLTPDATAALDTLHVVIQNQVTNFQALTETVNFPVEWFMFLRWALADDICSGQPQAIMARCALKCEMYRTALENWDVEDASTTFQIDNRAQSSYRSGFR